MKNSIKFLAKTGNSIIISLKYKYIVFNAINTTIPKIAKIYVKTNKNEFLTEMWEKSMNTEWAMRACRVVSVGSCAASVLTHISSYQLNSVDLSSWQLILADLSWA